MSQPPSWPISVLVPGGLPVTEVDPADPLLGVTEVDPADPGDGGQPPGPLPLRPPEWQWLRDPVDVGGPRRTRVTRFTARDGQHVVVKVYRCARSDIGDVWQGWSARQLLGAPLVPLLGTVHRDGLAFEMTPYFPDRDLAHLQREGVPALSAPDTRRVVEDLSAALLSLHERVDGHALSHGDVGPANLLVTRRDPLSVVLADLELVALDGDAQALGGNTVYQALEALTGLFGDPASDWWSMGMLVAEAGTGRHPLATASGTLPDRASARQRLAVREPEVPRGLSADTAVLVSHLLRPYQQRWGDAQVRSWLDARGSGALPETPELPYEAVTGPGPEADGLAASPHEGELGGEPSFRFAGVAHTSPVTLAAAMTNNWSVAGALVTGDGLTGLGEWAEHRLGATAAAPLRQLQSRLDGDICRPDRAVVEVIHVLDPAAAVGFRGRRADRSGLSALCQLASAGDADALFTLSRLHESEALTALSHYQRQQSLRELQDRWAALTQHAARLVERHVPGGHLPDGNLLPVLLLGALLSQADAKALRRRARRAREGSHGSPWLAGILRGADPAWAPAHDAVAALAAGMAAASPVAVSAQMDQWARDWLDQRFRAIPTAGPRSTRPRERAASLTIALVLLAAAAQVFFVSQLTIVTLAAAVLVTSSALAAAGAALMPPPARRLAYQAATASASAALLSGAAGAGADWLGFGPVMVTAGWVGWLVGLCGVLLANLPTLAGERRPQRAARRKARP